MSEINSLGLEGQDIFAELMQLIHATTGEFRELINVMNGDTSSGAGGGGGGTGVVTPATVVASTTSAVASSGVVANEWTTMLAGLTDVQRGLVGELYADVEAQRARNFAGQTGHGWAGSGVTVNVEGSVISEADLTNAINLAMQKITQSGGTAPSYEGLGSYVDFGET